jgi:alpha,alpha-trehalose phosphorylase
MMAARIGEMDKALDYYRSVATLDLYDTHKNTADGIHAANMGGTWMGLTYGFAGLRIKADGLHFRPHLPDGWQKYSFRFRFRDNLVEAVVDEAGIRFTLLDGPGMTVMVDARERLITAPALKA